MKTNRKKSSARSVRLLSVCMLSLFLFSSFGCAQDKPIVFDVSAAPRTSPSYLITRPSRKSLW